MRQTQKAIISSIFSLEMHFSFNTNEKKMPAFVFPKRGGDRLYLLQQMKLTPD